MRKNVLVESDAGKHFNEGPALPHRSSLRCCVHFYRYEQEEPRTWNPQSPDPHSLVLIIRFLATGCGLPRVSECFFDGQHSSKVEKPRTVCVSVVEWDHCTDFSRSVKGGRTHHNILSI